MAAEPSTNTGTSLAASHLFEESPLAAGTVLHRPLSTSREDRGGDSGTCRGMIPTSVGRRRCFPRVVVRGWWKRPIGMANCRGARPAIDASFRPLAQEQGLVISAVPGLFASRIRACWPSRRIGIVHRRPPRRVAAAHEHGMESRRRRHPMPAFPTPTPAEALSCTARAPPPPSLQTGVSRGQNTASKAPWLPRGMFRSRKGHKGRRLTTNSQHPTACQLVAPGPGQLTRGLQVHESRGLGCAVRDKKYVRTWWLFLGFAVVLGTNNFVPSGIIQPPPPLP